MIVKDWVTPAAIEIDQRFCGDFPNVQAIALVIERHCPFKRGAAYIQVERDVAYMPVPRCETCRWYAESQSGLGRCRLFSSDDEVRNTHRIDRKAIAYGESAAFADVRAELGVSKSFGCVQWEQKRCCDLDTDGDGNCPIHEAPGVMRTR